MNARKHMHTARRWVGAGTQGATPPLSRRAAPLRPPVHPFILALVLLAAPAAAQVRPSFYDYARPGLDWYTIETEHFNVVFHADAEGAGPSRTAQVVARIAEDVYGPITDLYGHEPDQKVAIVLKDYEDYANGAAYFFDNKIEIWVPALDSPLRGDHNWLRNVITHEFTHIVQVQTTMKQGRRVPFVYLQVLDYEDVKRPDVLYGYPDVIVTYPLPTLNNPAWLAEGTAQFQRSGLDYDRWDTHRDMLLRTRVLAGEELSLKEMGGFYSHTSLGRESVYNHGFAFTQYLASTYGEAGLRRLSESLGRWGNWNVERAMKGAFGEPGDAVYADWMDGLREVYHARTADVRAHLVEGDVVEPEGFANYYPRFSPDGRRLAYVSNKGEDFSRTALYVVDLETGAEVAHALDDAVGVGESYVLSCGHRLKSNVGGAFAWSPDGASIVYARRRDTPRGAFYADLYRLDLETEEVERLTEEARAFDPAFSPDGDRVVFVTQLDGTSNLATLDLETRAITPLTAFEGGRQVSDPAWHPGGEWVYFALLETHSRDLYRVRADGTGLEAVHATAADERSPAFAVDGEHLYFASDASGIFNLYRLPVGEGRRVRGGEEGIRSEGPSPFTLHPSTARGASPERLTNVLGGAFMPSVRADGRVAFSQYAWDGYKIAVLDPAGPLPAPARIARYEPPAITQKPDPPGAATAAYAALNAFDDTDLRTLPADAIHSVREEGAFPIGATTGGDAEPVGQPRAVSRYRRLFTSFSVYPTLRLDQYVTRQRGRIEGRLPDRTRAETLVRNAKVGLYGSSREILEGMTLFGGLLLGPGSTDATSLGGFFAPSNLLELERDAFLQVEYTRGFGILPRRWSPQLSVELYNIRRNVESGLSFEEFPCTACYPETTYADLTYSLWELAAFARSKLNRVLLLEAGYRYSPYRVTTQGFRSQEIDALVPSSSSRYYIGRAYSLRAYLDLERPHRHADVLPEGIRVEAGVEHEPGRLLRAFDIEDGALVPEYESYRNNRLLLDARVGFRLPGAVRQAPHGLGFRARATSILGGPVDTFFDDYVGGLTGARGYPFYALGGNETVWLQAAYHVPLFPDVSWQVGPLYVDKLYARLYADAAAAWSGAWPGLGDVRKDVGAELRAGLGSFYLLPTAVFVSATYGLDAFDFALDDDFVTPGGVTSVRYGRELLWHFGVLFSFDL